MEMKIFKLGEAHSCDRLHKRSISKNMGLLQDLTQRKQQPRKEKSSAYFKNLS